MPNPRQFKNRDQVGVPIEAADKQRLEDLAHARRTSAGDVARKAILDYLARHAPIEAGSGGAD